MEHGEYAVGVRSLWDVLKGKIFPDRQPNPISYLRLVERSDYMLIEVVGLTEARALHVRLWGQDFLIDLVRHPHIERAYYQFCQNWNLDFYKPTPHVVWFELWPKPASDRTAQTVYDVWFRYVRPKEEANVLLRSLPETEQVAPRV